MKFFTRIMFKSGSAVKNSNETLTIGQLVQKIDFHLHEYLQSNETNITIEQIFQLLDAINVQHDSSSHHSSSPHHPEIINILLKDLNETKYKKIVFWLHELQMALSN